MRLRSLAPWLAALAVMTPTPLAAQSGSAAGDSAWNRGDHVSARRIYLVHVARVRDDAVALLRLGLMASWDGRAQEGVSWFNRILAVHPGDRDARVARARVIAAMGELDAAVASIDSILTSYPDEVAALNARARFAGWRGELVESERLWRAALERDGGNIETRLGLSRVLRWQGRLPEARRVIAPVLSDAPDNAEARLESDRIEQSLRPRSRSTLALEDDSDGNTITTLAITAAANATDAIEVRGDAWVRHASFAPTAGGVGVRGGTLSLAVRLASGWAVVAGAGASMSDVAGAATVPTAAATIRSSLRNPLVLAVSVNRSAFDYTAPMARNEVVVDEGSVAVDLRSGRDWSLSVTAAAAAFDVRGPATTNARMKGEASVLRRLSDPLSLVLAARAFGFDRDVDGGYFDPDFFGLADVAVRWHTEDPHWSLDAEVAPGLQKIGTGGRAGGALRASAAVGWSLRPGRTAMVSGTWSNTGLQQLSPDAASGYRYASVAVTVSWWF